MECKQITNDGFRKLSGWFKKISREDKIISKTHTLYSGVSIYQEDTKLLATAGRGTVFLRLEKHKAFNLDLIASNALLRLSINQLGIKLYCIYRGHFILLKEQLSNTSGLDSDPNCLYWVSFEASTRSVVFGKHEPSIRNAIFTFALPQSNKSPSQYWMNKIAHFRVDTPAIIYCSQQTVENDAVSKARINLLPTRH